MSNYRGRKRYGHYNNRKRSNSSNRMNRFIESKDTKERLLDYIYDNIDLRNYKYKIIETKDDLSNIKRDYYISPNYNGTNCLLVFTRLNGQYYSFMVDRKTLSYSKNQLDLNSIKLTPVNIRLDQAVYNGSILDGVLLYNNKEDNKMIFIINDLYYFRGSNLLQSKINHKSINITTYLKSNMIKDNVMNTIVLEANNYYELKDIKDVINTEIPNMKYASDIKGIAIYPETSSTKLIFLYSNAAPKKDITVSTQSETKSDKKETIVVESDYDNSDLETGTEAVFEMRSTDLMDVYKLYLLKKIRKGKRKVIKSKKIGIAYIPTQECCHMCKKLTEQNKKVLMLCTYNKDKKKWIPKEEAKENKRPNYIDELYK